MAGGGELACEPSDGEERKRKERGTEREREREKDTHTHRQVTSLPRGRRRR